MELNKTRIELGNTKTNVKDLTTKLDGNFQETYARITWEWPAHKRQGSSHEKHISI